MLIHFIKVKTNKDDIKVSFDKGKTWNSYDVKENGTHVDDIEFTKSECNNLSDIIIGDLAKHTPNASESMKKYFDLETVNTKYTTPDNFLGLLQTLPENTAEEPYSIKIKGITNDNFYKVKNALESLDKDVYMDLSPCDLRFCAKIFSDYFLGENNQKYLTGITLPNDLYEIGDNTFNECINLKSIDIPSSITDIGKKSFYNCTSLESVDIPSGIKTIGDHAFDHSPDYEAHLEKIRFAGPIQKWNRIEKGTNDFFEDLGHLETKDAESILSPIWDAYNSGDTDFIVESLSQNGGSIQNPIVDRDAATMDKIMLDEIFNKLDLYVDTSCTPLSKITCLDPVDSSGFFSNTSKRHITSVTIPDTVTSIGMFWFSDYENLNAVFIEGNNLQEIQQGAFTNCHNLTELTLPPSLTKIGYKAFHNCKKLRISCAYNNSFSSFFENTGIDRSNIYELQLPDTLTSIAPNEFKDCTNLTSVQIPSTVTEIGAGAFEGCKKLKSVVIPDGVTHIKSCTFKNCTSLKTVTIPYTVTDIEESAFENCQNLELILTSKEEDDSYENEFGQELCFIGKGAFKGCKSLKNLGLNHARITCIQPETFYNCKNLKNIVLCETIKIIDAYAFYGCVGLSQISVPDTVEAINDYAFYNTGITSFTFPKSLKSLGIGVFKESKLEHISLPNGFTNIGDSCFMNSSQLEDIDFPDSVEYIDANAFNGCKIDKSVSLPKNLKEIGYQAFANSGIKDIKIPESVTGTKNVVCFSEDAFDDIKKITTIRMPGDITVTADGIGYSYSEAYGTEGTSIKDIVYIPKNITEIPDEGFMYCNNIKSLNIPSNIECIGGNAFVNCTSLREIYIPTSVKKIQDFAFKYCYNLEDIYYQGTEEQWKEFTVGWYEAVITASDGTVLKDKNDEVLKKFGKKLYIKDGNDNLFKENVRVHFNSEPLEIKLGLDTNTYNFTRKKNYGNIQFTVDDDKNALRIDHIENINAFHVLEHVVYAFGKNAFLNCPNLYAIFTYTDDIDKYFHDSGISMDNGFTVNVPKSITEIADNIFKNYQGLECVNFEEGIQLARIGDYAFYNCKNLNKFVNLPESVNYIGKYAFMNCKGLKSIVINESTEVIREGTFEGCTELATITYPKTLKFIETRAFYNCTSLGQIRFYDDLQSIGTNAFYNCPNVRLTCNFNENYSDGQAGWQNRSMYLGESGLTTRNVETIYVADGYTEIPDDEFINEPESIQGLSYQYANLKNVYLPKSVKRIGHRAFAMCSELVTLDIPEDSELEFIGDSAFLECSKLSEFYFPESLTTICDDAFSLCSLKDVNLPESLIDIGTGIFSGCGNLENVHLPSTMTKIPVRMFLGDKKLTDVNIPENVVEFCEECFEGCTSLENFEIRNNVKTVGRNAFYLCSNIQIGCYYNEHWKDIYESGGFIRNQVYHLNIDSQITTIPDYTFENFINLVDVDFTKTGESNLTRIGIGAFRGCESLSEINPPESCNNIQDWAFADCGIRNITFPRLITKILSNTCRNCQQLENVVIDGNIETFYDNVFRGCTSLKTFTIPESTVKLGKGLFQDCSSLDEIEIPGNITVVEDSCFANCTSLSKINIPDNIITLGNGAFTGCTSLKTVTLSENLKTIGNSCFENCSNLSRMSLPDSLIILGSRAFFNCSSLKNISVPSTLKEIRFGTFENCSSLKTFTLPEDLTIIEGNVFANCVDLNISSGNNANFQIGNDGKSITSSDGETILAYIDYTTTTYTLPSGIIKVGNGAFKYCTKLLQVTFPSGVKYIDEFSFQGCSNLQKIELPETLFRIGKGAFENCKMIGCLEGTGIFYEGTKARWGITKISPDGNTIITKPLREITFNYRGK